MSHPHLQLTLFIYIQAALFTYQVIIPSMRHVSAYMGLVNYSLGTKNVFRMLMDLTETFFEHI